MKIFFETIISIYLTVNYLLKSYVDVAEIINFIYVDNLFLNHVIFRKLNRKLKRFSEIK